MKNMKRLLSMLLCIVMVVGLIPASILSVSAGSGTIYVLAGGDYQEGNSDGSTLHVNSSENVRNILNQIVGAGYDHMDGFLFIGDYDGTDHNNATNVGNGITSLMQTVQEKYSNIDDANSVLVQGNHDNMDSRIDATGGHDLEGYSAYVLNEDDYINGGGSESGVKTLASNMENWLDAKLAEGFDDPIFVVSHVPLHYSPRTESQGDARYAKYLVDVLNEAGENGLNIIFLHGHDHAYGCDNYLGGEAIYRAEGDTLPVSVVGGGDFTEETLNFTYMNAGYTGYYNESGYDINSRDDSKLTMTVFAITDGNVTVERYSAAGVYNLASSGRDGSYGGYTASGLGLPYNTTTYGSPQEIVLTTNSAAEDAGTIGNYVEFAPAITDDVTASGNEWVELTAPKAEIPAQPGKTTYRYELATSITAGESYVIVGDGNYNVALENNNTTMIATPVDIESNIISSDTELVEWTFASATSGRIQSSTGYYLRYNNNAFSLNRTSSTTFTITDNGSNFRIQSGNYSFYYNGSSWTRSGRNTAQYVRLYKQIDPLVSEETPAVPAVNGQYGYLLGDMSYKANVGITADEAMQMVMDDIDVYYTEAMAKPADDFVGTFIEDSAVQWEWVDTFDGNTTGDYAIRISYNGVELGIAEVVVNEPSTYYIAEGKGLYGVSMNTPAADALAYVKEGVSVYSATDANGSNKTLVDDADVTWTWVDTYNGTENGPYTVDISKDGVSLGTVEVKVAVKYESGLGDWTYVGDSEATGGTYYKRIEKLSELTSGEQYLIILDCSSQTSTDAFVIPTIVTSGSGSSQRRGPDVVTANGITDNATITGDYDDYLWTFTQSGSGWRIGNGSQNINVALNNTSSRGELSLTNSGEALTIASGSNNPSDADSYSFAIYDSSSLYWQYNTSATLVYATEGDDYTSRFVFYGRVDEEVTPGGPRYVKLEGSTLYSVPVGTTKTAALNTIKAGLTAKLSSSSDGTDAEVLDDDKLTYTWKNNYNGAVTGSYYVEVSYNNVVLGTVEVVVEPGVVNNYPEYPKEGAVKVNKTATGIDFQASGVAQIEISASGVPAKKGADVIVMLDTSSSMAYCLDCTDTRHSSYVCDQGGQTRAQALEASLNNLITQFQQNGEDGEPLDIRVAIADFNGFYDNTGEPYDRDSGDTMTDNIAYTANSGAQIYTSDTGKLDYTAFMNAQDIDVADIDLAYTSGTNYDYAFDAIYQMGASVQARNEINGEERDLFVIFMSDGAGMQWNYYHSQGASSLWNEWITGQKKDDDGNVTLTYSTLAQVESNLLSGDTVDSTAHSYYFNLQDTDGDGILNEHRMANAIKGDPTARYEIIRKSVANIADIKAADSGLDNMYTVPGLGATMFSIAFDPRVDTNVTIESMVQSIETLASEDVGTTKHFYNVDSADDLANAFTAIGSEVAFAANNARFVDQMGEGFNLQLGKLNYWPTGVEKVEGNESTIVPYIEILTYDIWTRSDYEAGTITEDQIGVRKGTSTLQELVAFNADGTAAYSNLIDVDGDGIMGLSNVTKVTNEDGTYTYTFGVDTGDNIMDTNKVIYAKTFYYNANVQAVALTGVEIPNTVNADGTTSKATTNLLPSETFYWKLGTVQTSELAMRYFVYLEGSQEGTKPGGSYATNEFATLYYDNYLGNPCLKDTVSPQLGWKEANVSYAFYLVNSEGKVIVNQATGATGTFANKVAVTNPVVYDTILLNNEETLEPLQVIAIDDDVLPKYYTLYDTAAVYVVNVESNSTGSWEITKGDGLEASTYVTNHTIGTAYSNALTEDSNLYDYTHTVVWFAVVWNIEAHPDAVVVDYGLPVDINVLSNDMFGDAGKVNSVSTTIPWETDTNGNIVYKNGQPQVISGHDAAVREGFGPSVNTEFGTATVDTATNKITYQLNKSNGMQMNTIDRFAYAVQYTGEENAGYYYDAVTVIPATTIYYEESFVTFTGSGTRWEDAGSAVTGIKQDEDRPGSYSLSDANNIYGYDSVNKSMSAFSLGTAKKVHVGTGTYATATFSFIGTGFDVISMTSSDTGVIAVQVVNTATNTTVEAKVVNTYYGAQYNAETGEWDIVADGVSGTPNQVYQVPVLQVEGLTYGSYSVTITATYAEVFDKTSADGYDLYLDAIRIYDPAGTEYGTSDSADGVTGNLIHSDIQSAYAADGERWPKYIELRNHIIDASTFGDQDVDSDQNGEINDQDVPLTGLVFIDGDASVESTKITDYVSYGPNNEIYLMPGQRIAFTLADVTNAANESIVDNVHIGIRTASGGTGTYTITNIAAAAKTDGSTVLQGTYYNARTYEVNTTTDMYYDLTTWKDDIIVISNTGNRYNTDGVIALTNIKITYTEAPPAESEDDGTQTASVFMTRRTASLVLSALSAGDPVEDVIGNTNVPEQTPEVETPETEATSPVEPETKPATKPETEPEVEPETKPETKPDAADPDKEQPEDAPEADEPAEDVPVEDDVVTDGAVEEEPAEQLGFWARLWNAIKNAFKQLLSWLGF